MSNPSDPQSNQPDPTEPGAKPDADKPNTGERPHTGDSSYEFQLPTDGSYSDLPPVPLPEPLDAAAPHAAALPPRPTTTRPSSGSFDFIDLGDIDPSMLPGLPAQPLPPKPPVPPPAAAFASTEDSLPLPPAAPGVGDSSVLFALPTPTAPHLSSFALGGQANVPQADPASDIGSIPDINTLYPTSDPPSSFTLGSAIPPAPVVSESDGSFVLPPPPFKPLSDASTPDLGSLFPLPEVPTADPGSFAGNSALADLDLPMAEPSSDVMRVAPSTAPTPDLDSMLMVPEPPAAAGPTTSPTPDLDSMVGIPPNDGVNVAATLTPGLDSVLGMKPPGEPDAEASATRRSSFDFVLPDGVTTYSDIPPLNAPDPEDPNAATAAPLPPSPQVKRIPGASYDMFGLSDPNVALPAEAVPLADATLKTNTVEPPAPLFTLTANVISLPPAPDPEAVTGNLEPVDPVAPASGWLDSDVSLPKPGEPVVVPTAEAIAGTLDAGAADVLEGSDIFSSERAAPALPVEHSDVIAATAYGTATPFDLSRPVEPPRPSEIALSFDGPPGGSTFDDGGSADLPIADEVGDSGILSVGSPDDPASIHDLPDPGASDLLFDSSRLPDTPELPRGTSHDDASDYGSLPVYTADASSILADHSEPDLSGDSSSVRMDAPGVGRTHGEAPADPFDLTIPDEPIPADLFAESSDGTGTNSTEWQSQSGSDLFAEGRTTPEIDFSAEREGTVDPVDADLTGDEPSLTSSPSSIFSGSKPPGGSGSAPSGGSDNVRIGTPDPSRELTDADLAEAELADGDFAEFSDHPTVGENAPGSSVRKASSSDFELPAEVPPAPAAPVEDAGAINWDAAELLEDDNATRGIPKEASLSDIMRGLADDSSETPTRGAKPIARIDDDGSDATGTPVVTVDWMAASNEESPVSEAQVEAARTAPTRPKEKAKEKSEGRGKKKPVSLVESGSDELPPVEPRQRAKDRRSSADDSGGHEIKTRRESRSLIVGALLGGVLAGGAWAGMYFGGAIPNGEKVAQTPIKPNEGGTTGTSNGNGNGTTPPVTTPAVAAGVQDAFVAGDTPTALKTLKEKPPVTNEEKAAAGYVRVFAKVQELGKSGAATAAADDADLKTARDELKAAQNDPEAAKSPEALKRAVAASVRLGVSYEVAGDRAGARKVFTEAKAKFPAQAAVFDSLLDRLDATEKSGPGTSFRTRLTPEEAERVLFAVSVLLADDAPKTDDPEPGIAYWKAVKLAKAGNYKDAIDFIGQAKAAHLKRAKALAGRGLNPLTDPLEEMFPSSCDQLAAAWTKQMELYGHPGAGAALKADAIKTLDALVKDQADLVTAKKELTIAKEAATKLEKEAIAAKEQSTKLDKDLKNAQAELKLAQSNLKTAQAEIVTARTDEKKKDAVIADIATALKPAKVLPEKWTNEELVTGVKTAAGLASGADAQRVVKAEAAAKAAADKLAADTKALNAKYDTDTAKLKADSAAELKKIMDSTAVNEKKIADKFAADAKKLTDDYTATLAKLKADHETAIKAEQEKVAAEKKAAALREITFQKQLANAVTPAQAVDIWLPVLTDLRRASDAAPAQAAAARALESAVPDSEEAAKAHTVNGMALLLKGNLAAAKDEFQLARRGPAYAAAKGKAWAKAADAGLDATDDPLAPYRQPVVIPPTDLKTAAKSLDAGIGAYKAGKFDTAATALADAAKNDPTDPVAWYYLGAVRLALGDAKQAEKDIAQGAEREKATPLPARTVSSAIAPIQGAAREAIDKARP